MPNNPFGSQQTSSLPRLVNNGGQISSAGGTVAGPVTPSDNLLVNNDVLPNLVSVTGKAVQIDANKVSNRTSISCQNQGTATVEIYPNNNNPVFGGGGWQIAAGGFFDFNFTEDVKFYAITGGTTVNLLVWQNIKR